MGLFFTIFFALYSLINFYVFIRGWQALSIYPFLKPFYIIVFIIISFSYIFIKIVSEKLPAFIYDPLTWIGSFWFAFLLYFVLILFLIDITRFADHYFHFLPEWLNNPAPKIKLYLGILVLAVTTGIVATGFVNRSIIRVKTLNINLPKKSGTLDKLNIVMISDIHLSPINNENFLNEIVNKVNKLQPDIVLIPGDLVDDRADVLERHKIGNAFFNLKPEYGIYACTGNHEYINGIKGCLEFMGNKNIKVISDDVVEVRDKFNLIGRDDRSKTNFTKEKRKSLKEIIENISNNLPTILLDHTPFQLGEAENNNIDLQLSGHTHNGQMFPLNLITKMIYEVSEGYLKKGNTQYYVSSGVGSWGPPVKLASDPEIVNIKIKFE